MTARLSLFNGNSSRLAVATVLLMLGVAPRCHLAAKRSAKAYGLATRSRSKAHLRMPERADGEVPPLLSETGAFKDVRQLTPSDGLIPYDVIIPFWSDGADKLRWIAVPNDHSHPDTKIHFAPTGEWRFPKGTVFVKTFELATNEMHPDSLRRLETRLLVCDSTGGVYGVVYKWRPDDSDADLLSTNLTEAISIQTATGVRTQTWYYPSRQDCLVCHTANAGGVLGVKTRQLNRDFTYPSGVTDNELRAWNHVGLFDPKFDESEQPDLPRLARAEDATRTLQDRARSYLDANCSQCHRPRGTVAYFDARYDTPLAKQELVDGPVLIDQGIDAPRVISPHDIWRSILYMRMSSLGGIKMPPLAHETLDHQGLALLREWIESMPGPNVLAPPAISPDGGNYEKPIEVKLSSEPGATIRYTVDGTVPTTSDLLYQKPLKLNAPTILRAAAFKPGWKKSITVQAVFVIRN